MKLGEVKRNECWGSREIEGSVRGRNKGKLRRRSRGN